MAFKQAKAASRHFPGDNVVSHVPLFNTHSSALYFKSKECIWFLTSVHDPIQLMSVLMWM